MRFLAAFAFGRVCVGRVEALVGAEISTALFDILLLFPSAVLFQAAYWATRRKELKDVEAAAAERKKKYAGSGMQFTAQAMANKSGSFKS